MNVAERIEELWDSDELDAEPIEAAIGALDRGEVRVAEHTVDGWVVNEWVKKAILLYFRLRKVAPMEVGGLHFLDKIPVKDDYAAHGVRVLAIAPGAIQTPINQAVWSDPQGLADLIAKIPMGRLGQREEIAQMAAFLVSDAASYVTGTTVFVDGGMTDYADFAHGG